MAKRNTTINDSLIKDMLETLENGHRFSVSLPFGAALHLDRKLPFICVYRDPKAHPDDLTERLISSEAAYFKSSWRPSQQARSIRLLKTLAESMQKEFGAFLIIEICPIAYEKEIDLTAPSFSPEFNIKLNRKAGLDQVAERLKKTLDQLSIQGHQSKSAIHYQKRVTSGEYGSLLSPAYMEKHKIYYISLEVSAANPKGVD